MSCFQNALKQTNHYERFELQCYDNPFRNIKHHHLYHSFISDENGADSNPCDDPEMQVEKPNVSINDEVPSDEKENLQPEPDISNIAIKQISGDENVISTAVED